MKPTKELIEAHAENLNSIFQKAGDFNEQLLTYFPGMVGEHYAKKLLIVGRAVNGWRIKVDKNKPSEQQKKLSEIEDRFISDKLDWVIKSWGDNENYNTKKSAFWRIAVRLSSLVSSENEISSVNSIAWTNLYKASKIEGGNPSSGLMDIQVQNCIKILNQEIELLAPEYIVILTGFDWACPFLNEFEKEIKDLSEFQFVKYVGRFKGSKIIVAQHPQGKPEQPHFEEISNFIA